MRLWTIGKLEKVIGIIVSTVLLRLYLKEKFILWLFFRFSFPLFPKKMFTLQTKARIGNFCRCQSQVKL